MDIELMRDKVSKVYPGDKWKERVKFMPTSQIVAVYYSFLKNERFEKPTIIMPKNLAREETFKQLSFFDDFIYGYDESSAEDSAALVVGKRNEDGGLIIDKVYYDEEIDRYFDKEGIDYDGAF